jgi:transcriptional regulator of acetoin/glycerol metabolism
MFDLSVVYLTIDAMTSSRKRLLRGYIDWVIRCLDADKIAAALKLVKASLSPTAAARQLGLGRSTVYREVRRAGIDRLPHPA